MNILVTGAGSGIGYQTALIFLSQGHTVFALSRNKKNLEKLKSVAAADMPKSQVHLLAGDITDDAFVSSVKKTIADTTGSLHILINNAGLLINKSFEELSADDWQQVYATNVFAPVNLIKKLLPLFPKSNDSQKNVRTNHLVNIASMGGVQSSKKFKGLSAYSSSKAALIGVTECLAEELSDTNIAVNCLALGSSQTEMFAKAFPDISAATSPQQMARFIANFATEGQKLFNGKVIPVSASTP
jgi:NAD(P)-dependent dehydrogenase (short-subunit alcohol dehydrogenase family)